MKVNKIEKCVNNLVATDGFEFSGSSLINDIFRGSGYVVPKNVRADELFHNDRNFSWPRALDNDYGIVKRIVLALRLIKTILVRAPLNLIQLTPIYTKYLSARGRGVAMHQSTSVNRSLWAYFVSLYMVVFKWRYDEEDFFSWLVLKYQLSTEKSIHLLIDNGIPKDRRIADWFFRFKFSLGILVYRDPGPQYHQIVQVSKAAGRAYPSYTEFLARLERRYRDSEWLVKSRYPVVFLSFDKLLNDVDYRSNVLAYFKREGILADISYDFSESLRNNASLVSLYEMARHSDAEVQAEKRIRELNSLFEKKLNETMVL